ncbi:MAG: ATP-binding cassette domain-containing protein [Clostridia bacterium]|nr:ATP-binding cassette domain-containing protein [Clostridia bacterium]
MISVKDISFAYKNADGKAEKPILSRFSLDLPENTVTAVMGESGSGKTTLAKLLLGLQKPDSGEITGLDGKRISAVFQEDRLLPWYSARKNIASVLTDTKAENDALTEAILEETELTASADKPIRELSGGMQRRVAIGRALAFGGDLLILDEPLKGLDEELQKRIVPRIKKRFPTILLITHSEDEAKLFGAAKTVRLK